MHFRTQLFFCVITTLTLLLLVALVHDGGGDLRKENAALRAELATLRKHLREPEAIRFTESGFSSSCASRQALYYRDRWNTTEFYTDAPLTAFWDRFDNKWPNPCGNSGRTVAVIDIGTHVGDQVDYWARNFGTPKGCKSTDFYLFEPNPATYAELIKALHKAPNGKWHPERKAVSNVTGTASFFFNRGPRPNKAKNQMASLGKVRGADAASGGAATVEVVTMDSFFRTRPVDMITMLKIDTEGFDASVLFGSAETLPKVQYIVYECHKLWQSGSGDSLHSAVTWLEDRGFLSYKVGAPYFLRLYGSFWDPVYDELKTWQNCLAFRRGSPALEMLPTLC